MRYAVAALAFLVTPLSASAQMTPEVCEKLQGSVNRAAEASNGYLAGLIGADLRPLVGMTTGEFRAAAERTARAREALIGPLKEYAQGLEDLGYQLRVCARR